jgi:hypothetical protein
MYIDAVNLAASDGRLLAIRVCMWMNTHIFTSKHAYIWIHRYTLAYMHAYTYKIHTYIHTHHTCIPYMHTYIRIYIHTYIHTNHTQMNKEINK